MQRTLRKTGLTASIAIIALAVVLAIGSTFSLFTSGDGNDITVDSATVKVTSAIKSIETYSLGEKMADGEFANLGTALTNAEATAVTITNMTPGDEARVNLAITNESTVLIAYRLKVTVTYTGTAVDEEPKITKVIEVTANQGETKVPVNDGYTAWAYTTKNADGTINHNIDDITVSILLPVEAGNEYQSDSMKVRFDIEAVQANAAQLVAVNTAEELYAALETNGKAILIGSITLTNDIVVNGDATIDLNGFTLTGNIVNNGNLNIVDSKGAASIADASGETAESPSGKFIGSITNKGALTITGGTFENAGAAVIENVADAALVSENGSFTSSITNEGAFTIKGGAFDNTTGEAVITNVADATLVIEGGSFTSNIEGFAINYESAENIAIKGGSFSGNITDEKLDELVGELISTKKDENDNTVFITVTIIEVEDVADLFEKLASADSSSVIVEMVESLNTQDDQITETIIIDKEVVLNPNGMYLVSNAPATFTVVEGGKLVISEGSFTVKNTATNGACVIVDGGEFVMEGGSFDGHTAVRTTEGKSSTVTLAAGWSNRVTVGFELNGNDTLNVTGGSLYTGSEAVKTVAGTHTNIKMSGGLLSGNTTQYSAVVNLKGTANVDITGGTIESRYSSGYNGSPAIMVDAVPSVINISGTAKVSSKGNAVVLGDNRRTPEDLDDRFVLNVFGDANITATSDMGFGIRFAHDCCDVKVYGNATVNATYQAIQMNMNAYVFSNSTLTIAENAKITSSAGRIGGGYAIAANGNVTITGGTITGSTAGLAVTQAASVIVIDNSVSGDAITINSVDIAEGVSYTVNGDPVIN